MVKFKILFFLFIFAFASIAGVTTDGVYYDEYGISKTIDDIGTDGGAFFSLAEGYEDAEIATKSFGYIYIDFTDPVAGKNLYAAVLNAKNNGTKVKRIRYTKNNPGWPADIRVLKLIVFE